MRRSNVSAGSGFSKALRVPVRPGPASAELFAGFLRRALRDIDAGGSPHGFWRTTSTRVSPVPTATSRTVSPSRIGPAGSRGWARPRSRLPTDRELGVRIVDVFAFSCDGVHPRGRSFHVALLPYTSGTGSRALGIELPTLQVIFIDEQPPRGPARGRTLPRCDVLSSPGRVCRCGMIAQHSTSAGGSSPISSAPAQKASLLGTAMILSSAFRRRSSPAHRSRRR